MRELHAIRAQMAKEWKGRTSQEICAGLRRAGVRFAKAHGLPVRKSTTQHPPRKALRRKDKTLKRIVEVRVEGGYRLWLRFTDGAEGSVDLGKTLRFTGVFKPLKNPVEFAKVRVDRESGTIVWPNGVDLDPDVLHSRVTGKPIDVAEPGDENGAARAKAKVL